MVAPFGMSPKMTVTARMLPMARALAKRDHQVTVVIPPWDSIRDSGVKTESAGVDIVNIGIPMAGEQLPSPFRQFAGGLRWLFGWLLIAWRLWRETLASKPQIVYVFKPIGYSGLVAQATWIMKKMRCLKVQLVMDSDDWEGAGGWNERLQYSRVQKFVRERQEKWGLRHCDALTLASRTLESLAWSLGIPAKKIHYVPNGVPDYFWASLEQVKAVPPDTARLREPTVLVYTRFTECTVERILNIIKKISRELPEARFLVVGEGFQRESVALRKRASETKLHEKIIATGWVPRDMLVRYFAMADVAIYPCDDSLINRAKSHVKLLELMAAGKAIVADSVGEIAEMITPRESGALVSPSQSEDLARMAVELLEKSELRSRLGETAMARAQEHYDWDKLATRVESALLGATSKPHSTNRKQHP